MTDTIRYTLIICLIVGGGVVAYGLEQYTKRHGYLFTGIPTRASRTVAAILLLIFASFLIWQSIRGHSLFYTFWLTPIIVALCLYALGIDSERLRQLQAKRQQPQSPEGDSAEREYSHQ